MAGTQKCDAAGSSGCYSSNLFLCGCLISGFVVEVCHIPCPLDCKLSDWSAWSACSASCGSGLRMRSKWLREKAFNGGRPCPRLDLKNQVSRAQRVTITSKNQACRRKQGRPVQPSTFLLSDIFIRLRGNRSNQSSNSFRGIHTSIHVRERSCYIRIDSPE